jgi:hypothetical protein
MKTASILVAFAFLGLGIACTSTTTTTTTTDPDAGKDGGKSGTGDAGKKDAGGGDNNDDDDDDASTGSACADEADSDSCIQCCAGEHKAGAQVYQTTVVECICKADNCATECADTFCAETPATPDAACKTCFDNKRANCQQDLQDKCGASQDCVAFNQCVVDSKCQAK